MLTGPELIADINACQVPPGQAAFWWLGQHSFIVKLGDAVCYLDPFLTPSPRRLVPPLLRPEEVTNATIVLATHDHSDHLDRKAWPGLAAASPQAVFVVPELLRGSVAADLGLPPARFRGVDDGVTIEVAGVTVTGVPAAHELLNPDPVSGLHPCLGYVLAAAGFTLYHSGDCCIYEGLHARLRRWAFDLALLPINGRDAKRLAAGCIGNMTYQEAVDLAGALRPGLTVPAHFDMFAKNSEDPQLFMDYLRVKYPGLAAAIPRHGERTMVRGRGAR